MKYRKKLRPPSVEKVREILVGLLQLDKEGILHLSNIAFDEDVILKLEMKNEDRSRTKQMAQIREAAMGLTNNCSKNISNYQRIPQRERPVPGKFRNATKVFRLFLDKERLVESALKTHLADPNSAEEENQCAQHKLFELGFSVDDLDSFGVEPPLTHFVRKSYRSEPQLNPAEGLIGLSHKLNASVYSILENKTYNQAKTEKAQQVYIAACELYDLVSSYHARRVKAA